VCRLGKTSVCGLVTGAVSRTAKAGATAIAVAFDWAMPTMPQALSRKLAIFAYRSARDEQAHCTRNIGECIAFAHCCHCRPGLLALFCIGKKNWAWSRPINRQQADDSYRGLIAVGFALVPPRGGIFVAPNQPGRQQVFFHSTAKIVHRALPLRRARAQSVCVESMCDYSLHTVAAHPAKAGDLLVTTSLWRQLAVMVDGDGPATKPNSIPLRSPDRAEA
jgi:hypothetical protein